MNDTFYICYFCQHNLLDLIVCVCDVSEFFISDLTNIQMFDLSPLALFSFLFSMVYATATVNICNVCKHKTLNGFSFVGFYPFSFFFSFFLDILVSFCFFLLCVCVTCVKKSH